MAEDQASTTQLRTVTRRGVLRAGALAALAVSVGSTLSACAKSEGEPAAGGKPKKGGVLRVGVSAGTAPSLDPQNVFSLIDEARMRAAFDALADYDNEMKAVPALGESFVSSKGGTVWDVALREAVWHDGKPVTADDVLFSFNRMADAQSAALIVLPFLQSKNITKVDDRTVRFTLDQPISDLVPYLAHHQLIVVPQGFDPEKPVGSGPFAFESYDTTTDTAIYSPFPDSWRAKQSGGPHVDELRLIGMGDPEVRLNALLGGQIDAMDNAPFARVGTLEGQGVATMDGPSGAFTAVCMQVDKAPFDVPEVREAMRLVADRTRILENALNKHGKVSNDLFSWFDANYASEIPQREQDIQRAKELLASVGREKLTVELHAADVAAGVVDIAVLYAAMAAEAGINVKVNKLPADTYYDVAWGKEPLFMTSWDTHTLDIQMLECATSEAAYNETNWKDPRTDKLFREAQSEPSPEVRRDKMRQVQQILWDEGGYVIPVFRNYTDAMRSTVQGFEPHQYHPLDWFQFEKAWISK